MIRSILSRIGVRSHVDFNADLDRNLVLEPDDNLDPNPSETLGDDL